MFVQIEKDGELIEVKSFMQLREALDTLADNANVFFTLGDHTTDVGMRSTVLDLLKVGKNHFDVLAIESDVNQLQVEVDKFINENKSGLNLNLSYFNRLSNRTKIQLVSGAVATVVVTGVVLYLRSFRKQQREQAELVQVVEVSDAGNVKSESSVGVNVNSVGAESEAVEA